MKTITAKIYSEEGFLYEGEIKNEKPYGKGKITRADESVYMEGTFGVKGLIDGSVYYPNGEIWYQGSFVINKGYGPNYPDEGTLYYDDGSVAYQGRIPVDRSGLGYPRLEVATGFKAGDYSMPFPAYIWDDARE